MKNRLMNIFLVILMIAGVGILSYPMISNMMHDRKKDEIITEYNEEMANMPDAELQQAREAAEQYNLSLTDTVVISDPFDPDLAKTLDKDYMATLNLEKNGVMAYVEVPRLDIYEPVYHGTSDKVLAKGVGHLIGTSLPIGGVGTHAVLSGHTGLPDAEIFTKLESMKEGDIFLIRVLNETLAYRVDQIKVVEPSDTSDLRIDPEQDYVTLVTCTPYGINSHRLLVRGVRTEYTPELQDEADKQKAEGTDGENWKHIYGKAIIEGALLALLLILIIVVISRIRQRQRAKKEAERRRARLARRREIERERDRGRLDGRKRRKK